MAENRKMRGLKTWPSLFVATLVFCLIASFLPVGMPLVSAAVPPIENTVPTSCGSVTTNPRHYEVAASPETVHWGYYSKNRAPVISINCSNSVISSLFSSISDPNQYKKQLFTYKHRHGGVKYDLVIDALE